MVTRTQRWREVGYCDHGRTKVVAYEGGLIYLAANATPTDIEECLVEADELDRLQAEWIAQGCPWTQDQEELLERMSS